MTNLTIYQQARLSRDPRFDGQFFIAVKTTGIFCRPICPANLPKEENVEYFSLAQQAIFAGYRPCLRCRPDSAPGSFAWLGNNTTVYRAIKLIRQFPDLSIQSLCLKLGIGDRYLRQLFEEKMGISPKQYQLFERLLFAKKLLHESNLSVEAIALSSGFNSSRSLQSHFQKWLQLQPSKLKKNKQSSTQALQINLSYQPPYNWPLVRDFLNVRAIDNLERVTEDSYTKYFDIDGDYGWFCAIHNEDTHCFEVEINLNKWDKLMTVIQRIRRVLDLDVDAKLIEKKLNECGVPKSKVTKGLRLPGVWSPFEAACRAILGQQISVAAAVKLVSQLANQLREGEIFAFPTPEQIAKHDLNFLKMPQSRRDSLINLSRLCLEQSQEDVDQWIEVKGIGPWTIQYVKLRGLSDPDIWLSGDLIVKQQLKKHPIEHDLCAPWRSYLTVQLWQIATLDCKGK